MPTRRRQKQEVFMLIEINNEERSLLEQVLATARYVAGGIDGKPRKPAKNTCEQLRKADERLLALCNKIGNAR